MRELLPKGYLEKFKEVSITQLPGFFCNELTEDRLDKYCGLLESNGKDAENCVKNQKENKKLEALVVWLEWRQSAMRTQAAALGKAAQAIEDLSSGNKEISHSKVKEIEYVHDVENARLNLKEDDLLRNLLEFTWDFNDSGSRMFKAEEQLTHELFQTEIKHIDESFFKLPYQCCGFYLPFNNRITIKNKLVNFVYVAEYEEDEGRSLKFLLVREDEAALSFTWNLTGGDMLTQIKNQVTEKYESKKIYKDLQGILQFIVSLVLYINSTDVDQATIWPTSKSPINKGKISDYPVCSLGKGLTINKDLHYIKCDTEEDEEAREMFVTKWSVRGHFRNQGYGSGALGKYKKLIWIRPFLKGRERSSEEISVKPNFYKVHPHKERNLERSVATEAK